MVFSYLTIFPLDTLRVRDLLLVFSGDSGSDESWLTDESKKAPALGILICSGLVDRSSSSSCCENKGDVQRSR